MREGRTLEYVVQTREGGAGRFKAAASMPTLGQAKKIAALVGGEDVEVRIVRRATQVTIVG
jgi:hypothetical protein